MTVIYTFAACCCAWAFVLFVVGIVEYESSPRYIEDRLVYPGVTCLRWAVVAGVFATISFVVGAI